MSMTTQMQTHAINLTISKEDHAKAVKLSQLMTDATGIRVPTLNVLRQAINAWVAQELKKYEG